MKYTVSVNKQTDHELHPFPMIRNFLHGFTIDQLKILKTALEIDDPRLIQNVTATPNQKSAPPTGACLVGFAGWQSENLETTEEVEYYFDRWCYNFDDSEGEPGATAAFLNWFDATPRKQMRQELLKSIEYLLSKTAGRDVPCMERES